MRWPERVIEIPRDEDLPQTVCAWCEKSKLNGLFTPLELQRPSPRCRVCIGEVSNKNRQKYGPNRPKKLAVKRAETYLDTVRYLIGNAELATQAEAIRILEEAALNIQWAIEVTRSKEV